MADPRELLAKFGWTHSPLKGGGVGVMHSLLRGKAYSLKAELGGAPIAGALVRFVDRVVGQGKILHESVNGKLDYWTSQKTHSRVGLRPVDMGSRKLVEQVYGVAVATQLRIEEYIDSLQSLQPLAGPVLELMQPEWCFYWDRYVVTCPANCEVAL